MNESPRYYLLFQFLFNGRETSIDRHSRRDCYCYFGNYRPYRTIPDSSQNNGYWRRHYAFLPCGKHGSVWFDSPLWWRTLPWLVLFYAVPFVILLIIYFAREKKMNWTVWFRCHPSRLDLQLPSDVHNLHYHDRSYLWRFEERDWKTSSLLLRTLWISEFGWEWHAHFWNDRRCCRHFQVH